jgi:hypothetical protein
MKLNWNLHFNLSLRFTQTGSFTYLKILLNKQLLFRTLIQDEIIGVQRRVQLRIKRTLRLFFLFEWKMLLKLSRKCEQQWQHKAFIWVCDTIKGSRKIIFYRIKLLLKWRNLFPVEFCLKITVTQNVMVFLILQFDMKIMTSFFCF